MRVTVTVLGDGVHEVELDEPTGEDVLRAVELSPQEATVLVDGRPVPDDQPVEENAVEVLRLVRGG